MKIKLKKNSYEYILCHFKKEDEIFDNLQNVRGGNKFVCLNLSPDSIDYIRDWAGEKQQEIGFDEDYELNNEGKILDDIIDAFYIK